MMASNEDVKLPSLKQVEVGLAKLAAAAGVVVTYTNAGHLPTAVRGVVLAASGVIIAVNHWFNRAATPSS